MDKKTHDRRIFPTELSLITKEKRLIKVVVLHMQGNDMEDEGNEPINVNPVGGGGESAGKGRGFDA